jgi:hypothetical protein
MRRLIPMAAVLALSVSACGGGGQTTTTAGPTTTAAVASTTAATSTTAEVTTTTEDPVAYRVTLATLLAGEWEGEWRNTTYGSTGAVMADVRVDGAAHAATITVDLGGAVFGQGDPGPFELTIDLSAAPPYTASTDLLGEVTFTMTDTGSFTLGSADVPAAGIATFGATGTAGSERVELEYTVGFDDGSEAVGIATLLRPAS